MEFSTPRNVRLGQLTKFIGNQYKEEVEITSYEGNEGERIGLIHERDLEEAFLIYDDSIRRKGFYEPTALKIFVRYKRDEKLIFPFTPLVEGDYDEPIKKSTLAHSGSFDSWEKMNMNLSEAIAQNDQIHPYNITPPQSPKNGDLPPGRRRSLTVPERVKKKENTN